MGSALQSYQIGLERQSRAAFVLRIVLIDDAVVDARVGRVGAD